MEAPETVGVHAFEQAADTADDSDYHHALRLAEAAAALDREETLTALEREHTREGGSVNEKAEAVVEALLARFAELDPRAATLWLLQTYPHSLRDAWMRATLGTWIARDREAALTWARGLPERELRESVDGALLDQLSLLDPAAAEQQATALGANGQQLSILYHALAERNLPATLADAMKLPRASASSAIYSVLEVWVPRDLPGALAWAGSLPPGPLRQEAWSDLYSNWTRYDPAAAAAYLSAQGGPELTRQSVGIVSYWVDSDPAAAVRWADSLPPALRRRTLSSLVSSWAADDPRAAADYALAQSTPGRHDLIDAALNQWSNGDVPAALAWSESLPPGDLRVTARNDLCQAWARNDPRTCLGYLDRQPDDPSIANLRLECVSAWAESAPEDLWQWSRGLTDSTQRDEAGAAAAEKIAEVDPAQASAMLGQLAESKQAAVAEKIASGWVDTNLPAAQRWVANLPEGEVRNEAWSGLVGSWARSDGSAAAVWIAAQPTGAARDDGVMALLDGDAELPPADALRFARSITDEDGRQNALRTVARNWLKSDRAAATAWIQQAPELTPEMRDDLLASSEPNPGETIP